MFLHRRLHRLLILMALALLTGQAAWASTVGKVTGTVTVKDSGGALGGANVVILATTMGTTADATGHFTILNVPAGTYRLQASVVGYKPLILDNVRVAPDFTTEVDFTLEQATIEIQTIEVKAEKPLIQKDLTGTARFMGRDEIQNLPTRGYQEAAALQAGVVSQTVTPVGAEASNTPRLYIRGGRADEVAYYVDGFSQRDPLTGLSTTAINQNAIDQIVVLTGGFNAEYGKIMSGAVNVITREGSQKYSGSVEAYTDNLAGGWVGAKRYDNNTYDISLGGPLVPNYDKATFFISGERRWEADRQPRPISGLGLTADQSALFKDGRLPSNWLSGWTWQGKVTWEQSKDLKFRAGSLGSTDNWSEYRHEYLFDERNMPRYLDRDRSYFGTATWTPDPNALVTLGVNYFYTERYRGDGIFFKNLADYGYYGRSGNPDYGLTSPIFFYGPDTTAARRLGHLWRDYLHRESSYIGGKADVSYQWTPANQAKLGTEYRYHTLRRYDHLFPYRVWDPAVAYTDVDRFGYALDDPSKHQDSGTDGAKHPKDFSLFLQNKYEKNQLVVNAGLRWDYLNAETLGLRNPDEPLYYGGDTLSTRDLTPSHARNKISPRLGLGFPVSDRTQFHANYGIFYQQPNLENLYVGYNYLTFKVLNGGYYYAFGNPNLVPETTTAYELGFAHQLSDNTRFDVTAFYKNVRNLVEVQSVRALPQSYSTFYNTDYGTIKGIDLTFDLKRASNVSANVNYTLSFANGTGSVSQTQRNIAWTGGVAPKQTSPLDFDQRHKLAVNVDWRLPKGAGPELFGTRVLENFGVNVLANIASGAPYTPTKQYDEVTLAAVNIEPVGPINSRYGPWTYRIDLKADRSFSLGGLDLDAYIWVLNLLNRKNPVAVYTSTGDPEDTGWLSNPANTYTSAASQSLYELAQKNPLNFDIPRMVRFGLRVGF